MHGRWELIYMDGGGLKTQGLDIVFATCYMVGAQSQGVSRNSCEYEPQRERNWASWAQGLLEADSGDSDQENWLLWFVFTVEKDFSSLLQINYYFTKKYI